MKGRSPEALPVRGAGAALGGLVQDLVAQCRDAHPDAVQAICCRRLSSATRIGLIRQLQELNVKYFSQFSCEHCQNRVSCIWLIQTSFSISLEEVCVGADRSSPVRSVSILSHERVLRIGLLFLLLFFPFPPFVFLTFSSFFPVFLQFRCC